MRTWTLVWLLLAAYGLAEDSSTRKFVVEPDRVHLRSGANREWNDFPETPRDRRLERTFPAAVNSGEVTLLLRQFDVKQTWSVVLNGKKLGELPRDENDMVIALAIPGGVLKDDVNRLVVESPLSKGQLSDDVRLGPVTIVDAAPTSVLGECRIQVNVVDADSHQAVPCRLTVLNADGALQSVDAVSNDHLAVRPGTVYTSTGEASFGLPAGEYTILAGRGFEYSLARAVVTVAHDRMARVGLEIRREVPTEGYVACDPHIHTLTHSGHGDSTLDERMITLAGEGIELPVATDHNKHVSYEDAAKTMHVRRYFTPITGNEVTTPRGHFNIFPIAANAPVVDHRESDWAKLFDAIGNTPGVQVAILNHARDLHSGVRPFAPANHIALIGENLHGWPLRFNALEVINSGATQTDPLQLCRDWMGLLNRGLAITPVGSSDSHDVSRLFVGQGRTYIRTEDRDPGNINVDDAIASFRQGRVLVSYGLLTELTVQGRFRSGDVATELPAEVDVRVNVRGPEWAQARRVQLYANGRVIREADISPLPEADLTPGIKWRGGWTIPRPMHDMHLVAIATGPGIEGWHWRTAKPYQPTSPDPATTIFGLSGAVWLDVDGDGPTSARAYAEHAITTAGTDWAKLLPQLDRSDETIAAQAAHLTGVKSPIPAELTEMLRTASPATRAGFEEYANAWRESQISRGR